MCNFIFANEITTNYETWIDSSAGSTKALLGSYNDWIFYDPFISGSSWSSSRNGDGCEPVCGIKEADC